MGHWFVTEVWPNVFAWALTTAPGFVVSHLLLRRHITKTAAQQPPPAPQDEVRIR